MDQVITQLHANAMSACRDFPPGHAYDECYAWVATEIISGSQIAQERSEFLVIFALVAAVGVAVAALCKRLPVAGRRRSST